MRLLTPYWTSSTLASDLFGEMDRFIDDMNRNANHVVYDERAFSPACEISETDDHHFMSIDLPGMKREDIKIETSNGMLVISGERKREMPANDSRKVQRYEKSYGFFKRSFTLPTSVDIESIEARYENGVLEIYLPKMQAAKPKHIEIKSGRSGFFDKLLGTKKDPETKDVSSVKVS